MFDTFRSSQLCPSLSDEQLQCLSEYGREVMLAPGDRLFTEGDLNYDFYVVLDGEIKITKQVSGEETVLNIHKTGEFTGELSLLTGAPTIASAHAVRASHLLRIEPDAFKAMLAQCRPIADLLLCAMAGRVQDAAILMQQREKLAALGKLSAGLAHELNNPAAAARQAAEQLRQTVQTLQSLALKFNHHQLTRAQVEFLADVQRQATERATTSPSLDPLTQSDLEDEVTAWLEAHDVADGWKLASTLVEAGLDIEQLDLIAYTITNSALSDVLTWLAATLAELGLLNLVEQSTERISELVKTVKAYSYMDQAPLQSVDVHSGLESTLKILEHKLKRGVIVTREYDRSLPRISAYGCELNQVWTNLIDNSIDAMDGHGQIWVRTSRENDCVLVEIADNGPGIPPEVQFRIFEPFFTTKGVSKGTGLGLDIAYRIVVKRHHGNIRVFSNPGDTRFQVRLPIKLL